MENALTDFKYSLLFYRGTGISQTVEVEETRQILCSPMDNEKDLKLSQWAAGHPQCATVSGYCWTSIRGGKKLLKKCRRVYHG